MKRDESLVLHHRRSGIETYVSEPEYIAPAIPHSLAAQTIIRIPFNKLEHLVYNAKRYAHQQDYGGAVYFYNKALKLDKDNLHVLAGLGKAYAELGKNKDAFKCYEAMLQKQPNSILANINMAKVAPYCEMYSEAAKAFRFLINCEPNNHMHWLHRGIILYAASKDYYVKKKRNRVLSHAMEHFDAAINLDAMCAKAWHYKARVFEDLKLEREATVCNRTYLRIKRVNRAQRPPRVKRVRRTYRTITKKRVLKQRVEWN